MCVDGSQAVVQLRGALKRGPKKGISSACDRLRPLATVGTPSRQKLVYTTNHCYTFDAKPLLGFLWVAP